MSIAKRVARNTFYLTTAEIIHKILLFFLIVYATNILGTVNFGKYSAALAFAVLFTMFTDLGISVIMQRDVARNKEVAAKYLGNVAVLKLILIILTTILMGIILWIMGYSLESFIIIAITCFAMFLEGFSNSFRVIFVSLEIMKYEAIIKITQIILTVILGFYVLTQGLGLFGFVSIFLIANFGILILSMILIRKFVKFKLELDFKLWRTILKKSIPISIATAFVLIYFKIDTLMISWMHGDASTGIYNSAFQIIGALLFIPTIYCLVLIPLLSRFFIESKEAFNRIIRLSTKYILTIALPMCVGIALLSERIINFLYTTEYANAASPLRILTMSYLLLFFASFFYNSLIAMDLEKKLMKIVGIGTLINIILNIFLIPRYNYDGAAIATVITQGSMMIAYIFTLKKYKIKMGSIIEIIKPIIAVTIMAVFVIKFSYMNMFIIIPIAAIIYFISFLIIKGFTKEDIKLIKEVFFKKSES